MLGAKKVIYVLLLLTSGLLVGCAFVNVPFVSPVRPLEEQTLEGSGSKKILLLDISGVISEQEKSGSFLGGFSPSQVSLIRESLEKAERDNKITGVILRIDSPGGSVTASDIIRHDILEFKKRRRVKVLACIMGVGASGGYYVATAADRIVAHPTTITGSIGVILVKFNMAGLMAKLGVEEQTVKSGDKKDIMSMFRRSTPEEEKMAQDIIDQFHNRFLDAILERPGNKLSRDELKPLADGRVYTADQALNAKLIDEIAYLDDVIAEMRKNIGDDRARVVSYYRPGGYRGSIYSGGETNALPAEILRNANAGFFGGSFMYLWQP